MYANEFSVQKYVFPNVYYIVLTYIRINTNRTLKFNLHNGPQCKIYTNENTLINKKNITHIQSTKVKKRIYIEILYTLFVNKKAYIQNLTSKHKIFNIGIRKIKRKKLYRHFCIAMFNECITKNMNNKTPVIGVGHSNYV